MPQNNNLESTKKFHFNTIWFVPFIALVVAAWMLYSNWAEQGVQITIVTHDADGLEAGKTKVKARNVDLGEVTGIKLSEDYENAIITVQMKKGTEKLLTKNTKFWIEKPRVGREGISGLSTIMSGSYINMQPSTDGKRQITFDMLSQPPLSTSDDHGIRIRLFSKNNSKIDVGAPVHFRGYQVGYIENVGFDIKRSAITYQLFIKAPYDSLINNTVQFWMTPGLSVKGSAKGLEVKVDSLETFISGGISFGSMSSNVQPKPVKDLTEFQLFSTKEDAINHRYDQHLSFIALFKGNMSGLEPGAPVEFNGLRIGTVAEVPFSGMTIDALSKEQISHIPVLINIEPQRFSKFRNAALSLNQWQEKFIQSFGVGISATLSTSNLLTGAKLVSISFTGPNKHFHLKHYAGYPVFPTTNDSLASMQHKVETLLDTLSKLPLDKSVKELNTTLRSATDAIHSIHSISRKVDALLAQKETQALPAELSNSLNSLNKTLQHYQAQGEIGQSLDQTLKILKQDLEDLQPLIQQLKQKPNSLIFGSSEVQDKQPHANNK
ncbi:intermembrane transport protein PqiB [Vibrio salinus]|uniref:intermembrane transport protein PqiB n=1 Tax=Vibrio salinus TaxID=2899784 RepID=UPI001E5EBF6F|nr:intermembrane transport protein PqiB [Vibrio salinus]MCE0494829.1 intermembrane transport protein PqiB [Vibrio salinus]